MTVKEAILVALESEKKAFTYMEVYHYIENNNLYKWAAVKPWETVSAQLGSFIRHDDVRVKRIKKGNGYIYYLSKFESEIDDIKIESVDVEQNTTLVNDKTYQERDLHILLSSYLKAQNIYVKTIFHEKSNGKDKQQKWVHPDIVGISFSNIESKNAKALLKITNQSETYKVTSYELKRTISSDYELKEGYFQTVSNSSWANYGYLVAFEINSSLLGEIERLNKSFGIGVIELKANPFESKILFPSKYNEIDFGTVDKLCRINSEFNNLIKKTENILTAPSNYDTAIIAEFSEFCDGFMVEDTEIEKYCDNKNISY